MFCARRSFDAFNVASERLPHLPFPTKILQTAGKCAILFMSKQGFA